MGGRAPGRPDGAAGASLSGNPPAAPVPRPRGAWAEDAAARLLERAGLRILARNHRVRGGELDVVAREPDGTVVFVEVKQRRRSRFGTPGEHLGSLKAARVRRAALFYLGRDDVACRFDAVLVEGDERDYRVEWLRDAF